jgi:addiction module HigA family antidote
MRPIHPGEILQEELKALGVSARSVAKALGVAVKRLTGMMHEERAVTADTALRLARSFNSAPEVWLNLQSACALRRARLTVGTQIAQEGAPRTAA